MRLHIKVDSPPAVSFWNGANVLPYKIHGRAHHTICMEEAESPPTSHTKYMGTSPGAGGKSTAPLGTSGGTASRGRCLRVHAECNGQE